MDNEFDPKTIIPEGTQALLFDCDGTIANTMGMHNSAWIKTLDNHGLVLTECQLNEYAGIPTRQIIELISEKHQHPLDVEKVMHERDELAGTLLVSVTVIEPVLEIINEFHTSLPMAVISGGSFQHVEKTLMQLALIHHFPVLLTADDPIKPKPSPDLFLEAAKLLGVEPKLCVVLEDGESGLIGAKEAGMLAIDVRKLPNYNG